MAADDRARPERTGESAHVYRTLVEHASDGIAVVQDGRFVFANPSLVAVSGRRPEDVLGLHIADVFHPEDLLKAAARYEARMRGELVGKSSRVEFEDEATWRAFGDIAYPQLAAIFTSAELLRRYEARLDEAERQDLYRSIEAGVSYVVSDIPLRPPLAYAWRPRWKQGRRRERQP